MNIDYFFKNTNVDNSLLLGYYGGANFGDELLLEVIQGALRKYNKINITVRYSNPDLFSIYHKDYGIEIIDDSIISLFKIILKKKNIIVGGGGFWGLDFNMSTFLMSIVLLFARFILFKKVYVIGVGYYNSASKFAQLGAYLVKVSANIIIARDKETYLNFGKKSKKLFLDNDIVFYIDKFVDRDNYLQEIKYIQNLFLNKNKLIGLRRFNDKKIEKSFYENINDRQIENCSIVSFENINLFISDYKVILKNNFKKENVQEVINFEYNPVAFYFWLLDNKNIHLIVPQFHVILLAWLAGVKFVPIAYDYKVVELFHYFKIENENIIKMY